MTDAGERFKTYIQGFDEMMEGGIPKGYITLLAGSPGTMKSSMAFNMLYQNALKNGIESVYITLEQSRTNLLFHMKRLGMDYEQVQDKLHIVDIGLLRKSMTGVSEGPAWIEVFKMYVSNLKKNIDYQLLAVDSLPVLDLLARFEDRRTEMFKLFEWFRDQDLTTILIAEVANENNEVSEDNYLADGVIRIKKERVGRVSTQKHIIIDKMRATNHNPDYFTLLFKNGNFQVTQYISD